MHTGASIGPYRILRKIGAGGMGAVYLGEHTLIGRHAAIKVLLPGLSAHRSNIDRFFNEARAATSITDPGIVQVFDFGVTPENTAYIVMEFLEGEQLDQRLRRVGVLAVSEALRLTRQVAGSLAAAHAAGIVHRDLKPDNIYMIRDPEAAGGERPKLLDFGVAKLADDVENRLTTRDGQVIGTPLYMSPEQCMGSGEVDHRADIYSLGCVLFEMLTGRPPFDVPGIGPVIAQHISEPAPLASSIAPDLPAGIDELLARCLAKLPSDRFANMIELQQACDAILARISPGPGFVVPRSSGSLAVPLPSPTPRPDSTHGISMPVAPRKRFGVWIGVAVLAIGIGGAIAAITVTGERSVPSPASAGVPAVPVDAAAAPPVEPAPPVATAKPDAAPAPEPPAAEPRASEPPAAAPPAPAVHVVERRTPSVAKPPPVGRPKAKPPAKPKTDDLYDERN